MIGATLDANILASGAVGLRRQARPPAQLLRRWVLGGFDLILSAHSIAEVERTLTKPYFTARLGPEEQRAIIALLRRRATVTPLTVTVSGVATHPEDDLVLATALSGGAAYLVTGDRQLQHLARYEGVTIVSPRTFVDQVLPGEVSEP